MNFPAQTPAAVRAAITAYVTRRKLVTCATALALGAGLAGLIALAFLVLDRFIEAPTAARFLGPALCLVAALLALIAILRALLRDENPLPIAIRLDQALPQNQDRWATALELSDPHHRTASPASPELVARILLETDATTQPCAAASVVPIRTLKFAALVFALALAGFGIFSANAFFQLPLLWQRFWKPHANLPRASVTQVHFVSVNQHPTQNGRVPDSAWRVLENDGFALSIALSRRDQTAKANPSAPAIAAATNPDPTPRLEILSPDGRIVSQDFLRAGKAWTFSLGAITANQSFRIRAGDALTETFHVAVQPRIRITNVRHSVRFPGYARLAEIRGQPLKGDRLSLLEDAQIDFEVDCDQPIRELQAQFELLDKSRGDDAPAPQSARAAVAAQRQASIDGKPEKKSEGPRTRSLPVKIRQNNQATLRLKLDQPGLLRLRVTGENGLTGVERVVVIDPIRDAAPRLTVSGLEPDTYIVPGETVAFNYTVEDDLGVSDVIMDWGVAVARAREISLAKNPSPRPPPVKNKSPASACCSA